MNKSRRGLFLAAAILLTLYVLYSFWGNIHSFVIAFSAEDIPTQLPTLLLSLTQWASLAVMIAAAFLLWQGRAARRLLAGGIFSQAAIQGIAVLIQASSLLKYSSLLLSGGIVLSKYWITWGLEILLAVLWVLLGLSVWGVLSHRWLLPTAVAGLVLMAAHSLINAGLPQFLQLNDIASLRYILNTVLVALLSCGVRIALLLIAIGLQAPSTEESV